MRRPADGTLWQVATSLYTDLALDALQMAIRRRQTGRADLTGLVHHSDRGVRYRAIRHTQRLADDGAVVSVDSKGDSYDNAMAEAFNSLCKADLVRNEGPWRGLDALEIATVKYIDWYNNQRLHSEPGRTHTGKRRRADNQRSPTPSHLQFAGRAQDRG